MFVSVYSEIVGLIPVYDMAKLMVHAIQRRRQVTFLTYIFSHTAVMSYILHTMLELYRSK